MNRYAKIYGSIWTDERFCLLSTNAKLLYFYLISCKSCTSIGLFKLGKGTIMDEFCSDSEGNETLSTEELDEGIKELNDSGIATYKGRWVIFNQWMRWNQPSSPTHVPGIAKEINDLLKQKPPIEFVARLLRSMNVNLSGIIAKKDNLKKSYYAILKDYLDFKALTEFFGGEDALASAFNGTFRMTPKTPQKNHVMTTCRAKKKKKKKEKKK